MLKVITKLTLEG